MAYDPTSHWTPGAQNPAKYNGSVGPNYQRLGEPPAGYVYDPNTDLYYSQATYDNNQLKAKAVHNQLDAAANPPKPKGVADIVLPVAGTAAAYYGGKALAENIGSSITGATTPTGLAGAGGTTTGAGIGTASGSTAGGVGSAEGLGAATSQGAAIAPGVGSTAGGSEAVGGTAAAAGATPLYVPGAVAAGVYLGGKSALNILHGKSDNSIQGKAGRGILGVATGGISEIANRFLNGTKSKDQQQRDSTRKGLLGLGVADQNYNVTLADGTTYNIGVDGKAKLKNAGKNIDGKTERHTYDVDFSNPLASGNVSKADALSKQILGDKASQKQISDTTGMLLNAVTSNAKTQEDVDRNIAALQQKIQAGAQVQSPANNQPAIAQPSMQNAVKPAVGPANTQPPVQTAQITAPLNVQQTIKPNLRTQTLSPGIGLNGQRLTGRALLGVGSK